MILHVVENIYKNTKYFVVNIVIKLSFDLRNTFDKYVNTPYYYSLSIYGIDNKAYPVFWNSVALGRRR